MTSLDQSPRTLSEALQQAEALDASLNARLVAYRRESGRLRPDVARLYDDLVARLAVIDSGAVGPQIGEPMPDFVLPDQSGALVTLSSLLDRGAVVISINRGHWCPFCRLDLRALAAASGRIAELGAAAVSIMPESAGYTAAYAERLALPFPILSDIDLGYAMSLGLVFWVGVEIQELYAEIGVHLDRFQGNGSFFLPIAAKFVVGRDGRVRGRQVNVEFRTRMEPAQVIAVLEALRETAER